MATLLCTSRSRAKIRICASGLFPLSTHINQPPRHHRGALTRNARTQTRSQEFVLPIEFVCFIEQAPAAPRPAAARGRDDAWHTVSALADFGARRAAASRSCSPSRTWRSNQRKSATRGQSSAADLVAQAVRLRGLLQASPQVCQGVTQVCQGLLVVHSPGGGGGGDLLPGYFLVMPHNARGVHREG